MSTPTLAEQLSHAPFPEVAAALRIRSSRILKLWRELALETLPDTRQQSIQDFENHLPTILDAVADALEREDAARLQEMLHQAPKHGLDRFLQDYPLADLHTENRLLRGAIALQLEEELERPLTALEAASLHALLDIIFNSGAQAMVASLHASLRETAESELKFVAYCSQDVTANLLAIEAALEDSRHALSNQPQLEATAERLRSMGETVRQTSDGMKQLLTHERLRRSTAVPRRGPVRVLEEVSRIIESLRALAAHHGATVTAEIDPDLEIETGPDLLALMLQNIINNAITHGAGSAVRITADCAPDDRCRISVADGGPGIAPARLERIYETFDRGEALGTQGVGLGLAIASQAAKLLGAAIEIETEPGKGTVFTVLVPLRDVNAPAS